MLEKNPDTRGSAEFILNHAWFRTDKVAIQELLSLNRQTVAASVEPSL
jgi:hypothetical protein